MAGFPVPATAAGTHMPTHIRPPKNRGIALALALIFGGIGAHKFYLGRPGLGLLYLLFFWTMIPPILGLAEGAWYAFMSEGEFQERIQEGRI
jgi:TM2 domain-containing membrane protein YozV